MSFHNCSSFFRLKVQKLPDMWLSLFQTFSLRCFDIVLLLETTTQYLVSDLAWCSNKTVASKCIHVVTEKDTWNLK